MELEKQSAQISQLEAEKRQLSESKVSLSEGFKVKEEQLRVLIRVSTLQQ